MATETLNVPPAVGVPDSTPADERLMPGGSPVAANVYGAAPPDAEPMDVGGYACPTTPWGNAAGAKDIRESITSVIVTGSVCITGISI
jgi:hypothetical protein